ncbi:MAG: nickel pincer cofactor biosynthesis protein LarC [Verrucomicrobiota bacterium]
MRILHFDCFSGISGDMTVGALRDLGVGEEIFRDAVAALGLGDEIHLHFHRDARQGVSGWKFEVHAHSHEGHSHDHSHGHDPAHGVHVHGRTWREIRELLEASKLSPEVKRRSISIFERIAVAEAKIHGVPVEEIGFHEVGAADSIADIVAACAGIEALAPVRVESSPLVEGRGWIDCAHGKFPLPGPATLEILRGIELRQVDEGVEFLTPTGAAILAEYAGHFGTMSPMRIVKTGYGVGTRDTPPRPNVLRAVLGEATAGEAEADEITRLETNLDDISPEVAGETMGRLFAAGALDVFLTPVQMKKNRPGFVLTVLCETPKSRELAHRIFSETGTFGLRIETVRRLKLRREFREVETRFGAVRVKLGWLGEELLSESPEFEDCRRLSEKAGVPAKEVYRAAWSAGVKDR